jgi:hypothetical protein
MAVLSANDVDQPAWYIDHSLDMFAGNVPLHLWRCECERFDPVLSCVVFYLDDVSSLTVHLHENVPVQ